MQRKEIAEKLEMQRTVTPDELKEVKKELKEWGMWSNIWENYKEEIEMIDKQISYADKSFEKGKIDAETANKMKEFLVLRKNSIVDSKEKIALRANMTEEYISNLDALEQIILHMKYQKKLRSTIIADRCFIGRSTLFRKQGEAFCKIALMKRKE